MLKEGERDHRHERKRSVNKSAKVVLGRVLINLRPVLSDDSRARIALVSTT
jgi:predicted Holliday junction resolvase-like endonuclease